MKKKYKGKLKKKRKKRRKLGENDKMHKKNTVIHSFLCVGESHSPHTI
jgi:hypothetical protein